jgi:ABC-type polysaccharide/polyol phosphate export permease
MLWAIPIILIALVFALGVAILISTINVYFRDIASFLPYLIRTLLYLSPILYEASALKPELRVLQHINPLFALLDSWSTAIVHAQTPELSSMLAASGWAFGVLLVGTYFFLSREREFAVRL